MRGVGIKVRSIEIVGIEIGVETEILGLPGLYLSFQLFLRSLLSLGNLLFLPLSFLLPLEKCCCHRDVL